METQDPLVLLVPSVREDLLETEGSLVLMVCQDQRGLKEIVAHLAHQGQKVP